MDKAWNNCATLVLMLQVHLVLSVFRCVRDPGRSDSSEIAHIGTEENTVGLNLKAAQRWSVACGDWRQAGRRVQCHRPTDTRQWRTKYRYNCGTDKRIVRREYGDSLHFIARLSF